MSRLLTAPLLVIGRLAGHAAGYRWYLNEEPHHVFDRAVPLRVEGQSR